MSTQFQLLSDFFPHPDVCVRSLELHDRTLTATLSGQIRLDASSSLQEFLQNQITQYKPRCLILDCNELSFVDSQGLAMLLQIHRDCRATDALLSLRDPSTFLRDLLRLTRIDTYFNLC